MRNPLHDTSRAVANRSDSLYIVTVLRMLLEKHFKGTDRFRDVIDRLNDSISSRLAGGCYTEDATKQADAEAKSLLWSEEEPLESLQEKEGLWGWFTACLVKHHIFFDIEGSWEAVQEITILPIDIILAYGNAEKESGRRVFRPDGNSVLFDTWLHLVPEEQLAKCPMGSSVFLLGFEKKSGKYRMYFY